MFECTAGMKNLKRLCSLSPLEGSVVQQQLSDKRRKMDEELNIDGKQVYG